jgi:hypothetical protein
MQRFARKPHVHYRADRKCVTVNSKAITSRSFTTPIFGGTEEPISYEEFINALPESERKYIHNYCIAVPTGQVKKTISDLLKFYKGNVLKNVDIDEPTDIRIWEHQACFNPNQKIKNPEVVMPNCIMDFTKNTGAMIYYRKLTIDGVPDCEFWLSIPTEAKKNVRVRNLWDIPISEIDRGSKNKKEVVIVWHVN